MLGCFVRKVHAVNYLLRFSLFCKFLPVKQQTMTCHNVRVGFWRNTGRGCIGFTFFLVEAGVFEDLKELLLL